MTGSDRFPDSAGALAGLFHGIFRCDTGPDGLPRVVRHERGPADVPCPTTGRPLRIATIEGCAAAICPACAIQGHGGFVTFDGDMRMAYACPQCRQLVWVAGV